MDNFAEQLVKKQPTGAEKLKNTAYIVSGVILTLVSAAFGLLLLGRGPHAFVLFIIAVAGGIFTFLTIRNTKIEYEYTFTNGDLDIDKIIAQTKRKEMLSVNVGKFTDFGRYDENTPEETADMTVIMATDNIVSHEFYADFPHESFGTARLIFVPNEKMLANIQKSLHPSIRNKVKQEISKNYISEVSMDL